jgi:hypothetical protein
VFWKVSRQYLAQYCWGLLMIDPLINRVSRGTNTKHYIHQSLFLTLIATVVSRCLETFFSLLLFSSGASALSDLVVSCKPEWRSGHILL